MKANTKRKLTIFTISLLSFCVIALSVILNSQFQREEETERYLNATYFHAFDELVNSMGQIETALQKSVYATSPSMAGTICTEVFGSAMTAQMSLGALPCSTTELEQTAAFISRVGDYAYSLSKSAVQQGGVSEQERENLRALSQTAAILSQNLNGLQRDIYDGRLTMDELREAQEEADEQENIPGTVGDTMRLIEGEFPETPTLIYDGPFSHHIVDMEPKMLEGKPDISREEARTIASNFLGVQPGRVSVADMCHGEIPCYVLGAKVGDTDLTLSLSLQGGEILSMASCCRPWQSKISIDQAVDNAKRFLGQRGFYSMSQNYYMIYDNIATINFAYCQEDVICYSDLVKVDVALDTGRVVGLEATGYMSSHHERELPDVEIDPERALERVPPELEVISQEMALIPTQGKYELLCYEFKCRDQDEQQLIIYVNAVTGDQEKILLLLEDETGTLTI